MVNEPNIVYINKHVIYLLMATLLFIANLQISKSPIGPTKNQERHYNRVVVGLFGWLVATLVITASSHYKCCPADQTKPDQMI